MTIRQTGFSDLRGRRSTLDAVCGSEVCGVAGPFGFLPSARSSSRRALRRLIKFVAFWPNAALRSQRAFAPAPYSA